MSASIDDLLERLPHVEPDWAKQTITELALSDVSGSHIGAALLEVETHMAEHGGDVREVFGDPQVYAAALELPDTEKLSGRGWLMVWLPSVLIFLGVSALLHGVLTILGGAGLSVAALGAVLLVVGIAAAAIAKTNLLRFIVQHPVVCGLGLFLLTGGLGALAAFLPGPTLELAPAASLIGGALVLLSGLLLLMRLRRRADTTGITLPHA